jgi:predicted alpha/beta hydrolase
MPADEIHFPETPDGWRLALHRHRSIEPTPRAAVLLCPGYGCNRHFIDFDERHSLARFLARRGFDAWVVELRGRGQSRPGEHCVSPTSWTFDDLAAFDLPTAIAHVARVSQRPVAWVGHSMGGMLLYAYLGVHSGGTSPLVAGVTIASPVVFPTASSQLLGAIGRGLLAVPFADTIHQRLALGALWWLVGRSSMLAVGMNPENVDRAVVGRALPRALSNVPRRKLMQLAQWSTEGAFCSADRQIDYRAALVAVRTPLLVLAGSDDRLATPAAVRRVLDFLPATSATYRELGRHSGASADYGHVDLVLGRRAPDEVFPAIAAWLEEVIA